MIKEGCSLDGNLDEAKFGAPLPFIGIYVAAASLVCAVAMALDAIQGFYYRKFWFPCKYFTLNATSLTIIAVAVKFSVDLNTAMPRKDDQLAKLSSAALLCITMGNTMPSLGTMENKELLMNIMALGILVITVVVNICIQLGTGVIFIFWKEHAFILFLMLVMLALLSFSALTVPVTKRYLEIKYNKKYQLALKEGPNEANIPLFQKLKEDLMKIWIMAHTSSPQFVIGRSVTCAASGALCLLGAMTLAQAVLRSYLMPWSFRFCNGKSDYKWSTIVVLVTQTFTVGVGTIAPACRWFTAINYRCPTRGKKIICTRQVFKVEKYWIQKLIELKECPLVFRIQNRHCRKLVHFAKNQFLNMCIGMQTGIVLGSKAVQLIAVYLVGHILLICDHCRKLKKKFKPKNSFSIDSISESQSSSKPDLSRFVLHLEGEDQLVKLIMKDNCDATNHWMRMGKKEQPKHLIKLLKQSTGSKGFKGVQDFDSYLVPHLDIEEPPNCWALPVVTLASIAVTLPNIDNRLVKQLLCGVHEGLGYVKTIEESLDEKGDLINIRKAAEVVWLEVDLYHKWLCVDLTKLSLQANSPRDVLEALTDAAKNRFVEHKKTYMTQCSFKESPLKWPRELLASNSMYRITQTLLLNYQSTTNQTSEKLLEVLTVMISDIMGACITNIPRAISTKCLSSTIEERKKSVRQMVFILGKSREILNLLDQWSLPNLHPDQMAYIDEWRSLRKLEDNLLSFQSLPETDTVSSTSSELCLTIEQETSLELKNTRSLHLVSSQ